MITIKDIAREAGVSPSTVSRVISNNSRISKETSDRIKVIMEQMGYHPNVMAKSLASRSTKTLAIVLPRPAEELFQDFFFGELLRGILAHSTKLGYDMLLAAASSPSDEVDTITRLVQGGRVDGVILLSSREDDPLIYLLSELSFPTVLIGRTNKVHNIITVDTNNEEAAFDATTHLINQGHKRIAFVNGPLNLTVSQDRLSGYKLAMKKADLHIDTDWLIEGELLQQSGFRAMSLVMEMPERPTAMVVIDDVTTFGVIRGLEQLGYHVPSDISLVSFNNIALAEHASPPISSVDIGTYQLGYSASHLLIKAITDEQLPQLRTLIPHRLMVRESSINTLVREG